MRPGAASAPSTSVLHCVPMPRSKGFRTGTKHTRRGGASTSSSGCRHSKLAKRAAEKQPVEPAAEHSAHEPAFHLAVASANQYSAPVYRRPKGHDLCRCDGKSMFCRIRECYASEIGMCEPVLYFDDSDSCWQANEHCFCMNWDNHVSEFPWSEWFPGKRRVRENTCRECGQGGPFVMSLLRPYCEECRPGLYPEDF